MGKNLAIKGHPTRGKEVIELLEMMGGVNSDKAYGNLPNNWDVSYYIFKDGVIKLSEDKILTKKQFKIFTLEEFLEKYPFKVGDKIFLYDNITEGCVTGMGWDENKGTVKYCVYTSAEYWCDVKELLKWNNANLNERNYMDNMEEKDKAKAPDIKGEDYSGKRFGYKIPDGYEFDVVVDGKIFLKPIKPKYPTTYDDCCDMLNANEFVEYELMVNFPKLINARNAYWKIAGEQLGLGKPWEPNFGKYIHYSINFYFYQDSFVLHKGEYSSSDNCILVFPTEEMRDVFYENFKKEIEQCKELL